MSLCKMIDRHRFLLLEIHECYETYLMRRDQAVELLEQLRANEKRVSPADSPIEASSTMEQVGLLNSCVSDVQFQLYLCCLMFTIMIIWLFGLKLILQKCLFCITETLFGRLPVSASLPASPVDGVLLETSHRILACSQVCAPGTYMFYCSAPDECNETNEVPQLNDTSHQWLVAMDSLVWILVHSESCYIFYICDVPEFLSSLQRRRWS